MDILSDIMYIKSKQMKLIAQFEDKKVEFDIEISDSWFVIKRKIIKMLDCGMKYIDLEFVNQRPIREFGKQALLLGVLERIYDDYHIADFIINTNRELLFKVHNVTVDPNDRSIDLEGKKQRHFELDANDFPTLGSTAKPKVVAGPWAKKE